MSLARLQRGGSMTFSLVVHCKARQVYSTQFEGPLELGRQRHGEPAPYCKVDTDNGTRLIIADQQQADVSRKQLLIEPATDQKLRIVNLSGTVPIIAGISGTIDPHDQREIMLPIVLRVGDRDLHIEEVDDEQSHLVSLADVTMLPGQHKQASGRLQSIAALRDDSEEAETLVQWMYAAMTVLQSAASSPLFLQQAAQAVVDLVELDTAAVVRWDGTQWSKEAVCASSGNVSDTWEPSTTILDKARQEKRTFRNAADGNAAQSLVGVEALVAAPILDAKGNVIAALYGDRRRVSADRFSADITRMEAMLVELLASGVAAGLARLDQEREAMATRVRFEQAFTSELVRQIEAQPELLNSKDADISVLFCDVRGFSRISERLGPSRTFAWISDVMEELSECVGNHDGVLVDYIGDELIAMWGTPVAHPDHAARACRAALDMIQRLDVLNQRWHTELGEAMGLGVGINSGSAQVGNTGTKRKFKYGPLGNTVNLASRVEGATKHLKSSVLATGYTADRLDDQLNRRRLSRVRVINIVEPVDLYELVAATDDNWRHLRDRYETALKAFEEREFFTATKFLGNLVAEYPADGPSQLLLLRAVSAMIDPEDFDPVWNLTSK